MKNKKKSLKKKNPSKTKAIIFDIGGVLQLEKKQKSFIPLIKKNKGIHQSVAFKLNVGIDQYLDSIDTAYAKSITGQIKRKQLLYLMSRRFNQNPEKILEIYHETFKKNFILNKELLDKAKQLKKQRYKIAIISDMWPFAKDVLVIKEFYKTFDFVLLSCDTGLRKPQKEIYYLALKKLDIKPAQAVFIDNQKWNTQAAEKLGIKTILFKKNKQTIGELNKILEN